MRTLLAFALSLALGLTIVSASLEQASVGQSSAELREIAGPPSGFVKRADSAIWIYPNGRAILSNDLVVKLDLTQREPIPQRDRTEIANRELRRRIYSPEFVHMDPASQLRYLQSFRHRHPEIEITAELDRARDRLERQLEASESAEPPQEPEVANANRSTRARTRTVFFSSGHRHGRGHVDPPASPASPPRTTYYSREEQLFGNGAITPISGVEPIAPFVDPYR